MEQTTNTHEIELVIETRMNYTVDDETYAKIKANGVDDKEIYNVLKANTNNWFDYRVYDIDLMENIVEFQN